MISIVFDPVFGFTAAAIVLLVAGIVGIGSAEAQLRSSKCPKGHAHDIGWQVVREEKSTITWVQVCMSCGSTTLPRRENTWQSDRRNQVREYKKE